MRKTIIVAFLTFLLFGVIFLQIRASIKVNDGNFIYPLDDTYIHMAMAKNLAFSGQWGITKYEFSSSSSSILYTLLLALIFKVTGPNEVVPLIVNLLAGVLILGFLWKVATKEKWKSTTTLIAGMMILFFTPMPALIISGMEHSLQILIGGVFVYYSSLILEQRRFTTKTFATISLLAAFAVMIRFEGLFLVLLISALIFFRGKPVPAIFVLIAGLLPVIIFGIVSIQNGSYFIPNSLLMKGQKPEMSFFGLIKFAFGWLPVLEKNPHLMTLFIWLLLYFVYLQSRKVSFWHRPALVVLITSSTMLIHLTLAKTGWFFRYEAYLVFLSLLSFAWIINDQLKRFTINMNSMLAALAVVILMLASFYPVYSRGIEALRITVPATTNIYQQQIQMAGFIHKYYNDAEVCANDIGAITYYSDIHLFDIFGLASREIIAARMKGTFDQSHIRQIAIDKKTKIAVLYDTWFIGKIPHEWIKVGEWKISNNVILGGDAVSFYATDQSQRSQLISNLRDFRSELPVGVGQSGDYTK